MKYDAIWSSPQAFTSPSRRRAARDVTDTVQQLRYFRSPWNLVPPGAACRCRHAVRYVVRLSTEFSRLTDRFWTAAPGLVRLRLGSGAGEGRGGKGRKERKGSVRVGLRVCVRKVRSAPSPRATYGQRSYGFELTDSDGRTDY